MSNHLSNLDGVLGGIMFVSGASIAIDLVLNQPSDPPSMLVFKFGIISTLAGWGFYLTIYTAISEA